MRDQIIFLTGSNGFIGTEVKSLLEKQSGIEVVVHNRKTHPYQDKVKLAGLLSNVDTIVHIGGLVKGTHEELLEANVKATLSLVTAAIENGRKPHFIYISSFAVYQAQEKKINEKTKTEPRNFYGLSKHMGEEVISHFCRDNKISATILRLSNVYGPRMPQDWHSVLAFLNDKIKSGENITLNGDGKQVRDFIHVHDVAIAILSAVILKDNLNAQVVNVCSGEETSLNLVVKLFSKKYQVTPVTSHNTNNEEGYWVGDPALALNKLKWKPSILFKDGIQSI